jgi:putative Holliday junction resolvase
MDEPCPDKLPASSPANPQTPTPNPLLPANPQTPTPNPSYPLPLLGLDSGDKRIGVAYADETGRWVHALETLKREKGSDEFGRLAQIVKERRIRGFVIGLPLLREGAEGEQARKARGFARAVARAHPKLYVALTDERLSTFAAEEERIEAGFKRGKDRGPGADAHAARHILEGFLREGPLEVVQEEAP